MANHHTRPSRQHEVPGAKIKTLTVAFRSKQMAASSRLNLGGNLQQFEPFEEEKTAPRNCIIARLQKLANVRLGSLVFGQQARASFPHNGVPTGKDNATFLPSHRQHSKKKGQAKRSHHTRDLATCSKAPSTTTPWSPVWILRKQSLKDLMPPD